MGEDAEQALPLAGLVRAGPQGRPEQPLVPAEHALRLPPLAIHPPVPTPAGLLPEPPHHLAAVPRLRPPPAGPAAVQRDDGGPDREALAGGGVVVLGVV